MSQFPSITGLETQLGEPPGVVIALCEGRSLPPGLLDACLRTIGWRSSPIHAADERARLEEELEELLHRWAEGGGHDHP